MRFYFSFIINRLRAIFRASQPEGHPPEVVISWQESGPTRVCVTRLCPAALVQNRLSLRHPPRFGLKTINTTRIDLGGRVADCNSRGGFPDEKLMLAGEIEVE